MNLDRPTRLLLVDDDEDSLQGLALLLRHAGYEVRASTTAGGALSIAPDFSPHVAILDIGLRDASGLELADQLKAVAQTPGCVVLALSGYAEDAASGERAGRFAHYFTKPVDTAALLETLKGIAEQRAV